jgi:hypothetical protein
MYKNKVGAGLVTDTCDISISLNGNEPVDKCLKAVSMGWKWPKTEKVLKTNKMNLNLKTAKQLCALSMLSVNNNFKISFYSQV